MKHSLIIAIALVSWGFVFGQGKLLTVKDAEIGQWRDLYPTTMQNLQWRDASNAFTFQDYYHIYQQTISSEDTVTLTTLEKINLSLKNKNLDTLTFIPVVTWGDNNDFYFYTHTQWINYNLLTQSVTANISIPEEAENFDLYYPTQKLVYTIDNNLFVASPSQPAIQITRDSDKNIVNGQIVSRNEFGIEKGTFWSPKGNYLAFYRKDNSDVKDYPLVDITQREAEADPIKYPMAGMASEHISLGVYNLNSQQTTFIERKDSTSEKYLTNITWGPEENYIYIQVLNREQNHMLLNKYKVTDGLLDKTLFEERNEKYVEPLNPLIFLNKAKNTFIYQTRKDGYNHAYLYTDEGNLVKKLTSGPWEITQILGLDEKDNLFYESTEVSPIERQVYKINCKSGKKLRLTGEAGTHRVNLNKNGKYLLDNFSNTTTPRIISVLTSSGKIQRTVLTAKNPLKDYDMPIMKIGTLKAADDSTDLYYRMITPINFDSTKQYPAIVYVYGGPHTQLVENRWLGGARLWDYMMAQKGYVVFTVDNRGSSNRGLTFENVIHRQCGVNEMKDQMKGVDFLKKSGFVDMNRLGVHGWSYGGFMTISLMVNYPDIFKVAVAGGPVIDWKYYEVMYGERYMDTPQENPEGYAFTSLIPRAKDLKGKLLIIHGAIDNTVVWQNSQLFVQECIKNQVPVDYFIYPRAEHNVRGMDRIHLMNKITTYFEDYLK